MNHRTCTNVSRSRFGRTTRPAALAHGLAGLVLWALAAVPIVAGERPEDRINVPPRVYPDMPERRTTPPIEGVNNAWDVNYLPMELGRYHGVSQDRFAQVDIHWPKREDRFPMVVIFHGGGVGHHRDQSKDKYRGPERRYTGFGWRRHEEFAYAIERGYGVAVVGFPLGIDRGRLQRWHAQAVIRFLRAHAEVFSLDPDFIFVYGSSSGSSVAGGLFQTYVDRNRAVGGLTFPDNDPRSPWHEQSAQVQGMYSDISNALSHARSLNSRVRGTIPGRPAIISLFSEIPAEAYEIAERSGGNFLFAYLHGAGGSHLSNWEVPSTTREDPEPKPVRERFFDFLDYLSSENPQTPRPEFRPQRTVFTDHADIRIVTTSEGIKTRYTLDGSDPTEGSPLYEVPIRITETTTIRAYSQRPGQRPSAILTGTFRRGNPPPIITGPHPAKLPKAVTGQPYRAVFTTDAEEPVRWVLTGHLATVATGGREDEGLSLDSATGELTGTPRRPGAFTFIVGARRERGGPADARIYTLHVLPEE